MGTEILLSSTQFASLAKLIKRRHKIQRSDVVLVSHAKSGRTWLAAMISSVYHRRYGIPESEIIRFDNFQRFNAAVPALAFSHDNRKDPSHRPILRPADLKGRRVLLLVRDPRDISVSSYFQLLRNGEKGQVERPPLFKYVVREKLPQVLTFLQRWAGQLDVPQEVLIVRYEDLRVAPERELERVMTFLDNSTPAQDEIRRAVAFASFQNLRQKEASGFFSTDRLRPRDPADPNSFKVRRGKVGGYRDYFSLRELAEIEAMIAGSGLRRFGYFPASADTRIRA